LAKKVAVETTLTGIKQVLAEQGYTVVDPKGNLNDATAVVVTGADNNFADIQDIVTKAPVIDASGKTPEEILSRIKALD
jgi:hypothetical protein